MPPSSGPSQESLMLRILLAGIVGGIVVFIWGAVSHMVLQVGDMGLSEKKVQAGPRGMLVIDPRPTDQPFMPPSKLGIELASNVLAALIAACIVSAMFTGMFARVLAVAAMGLFGWMSLVVSYW